MQQIILASNNAGKIKEFTGIFKTLNIEIIPQSEFNIPEVDEPYLTFVENALHKARHCSSHTGLPALADDSGICVTSLNGGPGIYSARYAGEPKSSSKNNQKLVAELTNFSDKSAYYYCILVLLRHTNDPQPIIADGRLDGEIVNIPQWNNGFGYDPYFYLAKYNKTVAELDPEIKNKISHRALAIKKLLSYLEHNNGELKV